MQLTVGLDRSDKPAGIDEFMALGVDEFFAGFVPGEWSERFGWEVGLNRRTFGGGCQFTDIDELREAIQTVHAGGKRILITLNGHDYGHERLPMVREVVQALEGLGHDGYVVADPALMGYLREWGVDSLFHLSTGGGAFNSETIRFYHERFGLRRVVIPRKMTLREMRILMERVADLDLEFEVMVIGYRCHFNDEFCFSLHCGTGNNLCTEHVSTPKQLRGRFPGDWKDIIEEAIDYPAEQFSEGSRLDEFSRALEAVAPPERLPPESPQEGQHSVLPLTMFNNCGLCAIPALREMGVHTLKIPVRGAPWQKRYYLEVVRAVANQPGATAADCRALVNSAGFCALPEACYYHLADQEN